MSSYAFLQVAVDLEHAGLVWQPEIGDEVSKKGQEEQVSILVDPQGLTPAQLRQVYLWLPTVEQMVRQFEARQAILTHTGLEMAETEFYYSTVIETHLGEIEARAASLRTAFGLALRDLLLAKEPEEFH